MFSANYIFRTQYYIVADGKYGALKDDGTFNGLIGELEAGRGDAAPFLFGETSERNRAADPSVPFGTYE